MRARNYIIAALAILPHDDDATRFGKEILSFVSDSEHLFREVLRVTPFYQSAQVWQNTLYLILVDDPSPGKIALYDPLAGGPNIIDDTAGGGT